MIEFWQRLVAELEEAQLEMLHENDVRNARALQDLATRARWVELDLRDYDNESEFVRSARRVYASWFTVYTDGVAREAADQCIENARLADIPW